MTPQPDPNVCPECGGVSMHLRRACKGVFPERVAPAPEAQTCPTCKSPTWDEHPFVDHDQTRVKVCRDPFHRAPALSHARTTPAEPSELGLNIDMLDADRLTNWADNFESTGNDLSQFASRTFVIAELRRIAEAIAREVRDVGALRVAHARLKLQRDATLEELTHQGAEHARVEQERDEWKEKWQAAHEAWNRAADQRDAALQRAEDWRKRAASLVADVNAFLITRRDVDLDVLAETVRTVAQALQPPKEPTA